MCMALLSIPASFLLQPSSVYIKKQPFVHPHVLLLFLKIFKNIWPYDSFHMLLTRFDIANLFLTFACLCKRMFVETWWKCFALHFRSTGQKQQIIALPAAECSLFGFVSHNKNKMQICDNTWASKWCPDGA